MDHLLTLSQDKPYTYLGIQFIPLLKWKLQQYSNTKVKINKVHYSSCPSPLLDPNKYYKHGHLPWDYIYLMWSPSSS